MQIATRHDILIHRLHKCFKQQNSQASPVVAGLFGRFLMLELRTNGLKNFNDLLERAYTKYISFLETLGPANGLSEKALETAKKPQFTVSKVIIKYAHWKLARPFC